MIQKTILEDNASDFKTVVDNAISMGWRVLTVAINSDTNYWFAVLEKERKYV
jgi:hypothetical protein